MHTLARLVRPVPALLILSIASAAQLGGTPTTEVPAPGSGPISSGSTPSSSSPAHPVATWDDLLASAEPALTPSVMTRSRLDPVNEASLDFAEIPGGIVLGLPARGLLGERRAVALVELAGGGLGIRMEDGATLALPAGPPAIVQAALRFAADGAGHWVVDLEADGGVVLAREFVDSQAGLVAVRADVSPLFFLPSGVGVKSNIVDRDVRITAAPDGVSARLEVDLELRFYRPDRPNGALVTDEDGAVRVGTFPFVQAGTDAHGRPMLAAPVETGDGGKLLAGNLSELAELASWIGFFRWAVANDLDGIDAVRAAHEAARAPRVNTPRRIDERDRANWVRGAGSAPDASVPDWMRAHAERVNRERAGTTQD